jgi:hypothetical protein
VEIHLIVAFEEAAEEQPIDVLGLRVGGEAGVEIGGIGFDDESEGRRIGVLGPRAAKEEDYCEGADK